MQTIFEAWFDGGCWPKNPGGYATYGSVIAKDGETIWEGSGLVVPTSMGTTNNLAEYAAYIVVLNELEKRKLTELPITIYGDSKLVINQMQGAWKIKKGSYAPLAIRAKDLTKRFPNIQLEWIPRDKNSMADALAAKALYQNGSICVPCITAAQSQHGSCSCFCHHTNENGV